MPVSSGPSLPIAVAIPRLEVEPRFLQQRTYYVVETTAFGMPSLVRRTFEDFESLHGALAHKVKFALLPLPRGRSFFNEHPRAAEERRAELERLLQRLLTISELLCSEDGRLLRFLDVQRVAVAASRFVIAPPGGKGDWLQLLHKTTAERGGGAARPLHETVVQDALVSVVTAAQSPFLRASPGDTFTDGGGAQADAVLACELFARLFRGDGRDLGQSDIVSPERVVHVKALLALVAHQEDASDAMSPSHGQASTSQAAAEAVQTLVRADRTAWSRVLLGLLDSEGVELLVAAADVGDGSGVSSTRATSSSSPAPASKRRAQRLVAELLVRGFDGDVVQRFSSSDIAVERKRLLNLLFASRDPFVRIVVGLLLARLVSEDSGFGEAAAAEAGVRSLCEELLAPRVSELAEAELVFLVMEDGMWAWLCELAASLRPLVAAFALLVVLQVGSGFSPALVTDTPAFHELLVSQLAPELDPTVRGLAARVLLATYRGTGRPVPENLTLNVFGSALALSAESVLTRDDAEHKELGERTAEAQNLCRRFGSTSEPLHEAFACAAQMKARAEAWTETLALATSSAEAACEKHLAAGSLLTEQGACLGACTEQLDEEEADGSPSSSGLNAKLKRREEQMAAAEADLAEREERLRVLTETRSGLAATQAEGEAAERRWLKAVCEARASAQEAEGASTDAGSACEMEAREEHERALEAVAAIRDEAEVVEEQLRMETEQLPELRKAIVSGRQHIKVLATRCSDGVEAWGSVLDAHLACRSGLLGAGERVRETCGRLEAERQHRKELRNAIRVMSESLGALDDHLAFLEQQDSMEESGRIPSVSST